MSVQDLMTGDCWLFLCDKQISGKKRHVFESHCGYFENLMLLRIKFTNYLRDWSVFAVFDISLIAFKTYNLKSFALQASLALPSRDAALAVGSYDSLSSVECNVAQLALNHDDIFDVSFLCDQERCD